jgi:hypothetical protein
MQNTIAKLYHYYIPVKMIFTIFYSGGGFYVEDWNF